MKIKYNSDGEILAVALDSINLADSIIVSDNQDLLLNPMKYRYNTQLNAIELKPYCILSCNREIIDGIYQLPFNENTEITITAYTNSGQIDTSFNGSVKVYIDISESYQLSSEIVNLTNGVGNFTVTPLKRIETFIVANCPNIYIEPLHVKFV